MIIFAFPGTLSVGNPSVLCLRLLWEQLLALLCVLVSVSWQGSFCDCWEGKWGLLPCVSFLGTGSLVTRKVTTPLCLKELGDAALGIQRKLHFPLPTPFFWSCFYADFQRIFWPAFGLLVFQLLVYCLHCPYSDLEMKAVQHNCCAGISCYL